MLIPYDPFSDWEKNSQFGADHGNQECHYATEVAEMLQFHSMEDISDAIDRAMQVCRRAGIAVPVHFRQVFRYTREGLQRDLRLSNLASYLVIINAGTEHQVVAQAQIFSYLKNGK